MRRNLQTPRLVKKKRKTALWRLSLWTVFILVLLGGVAYASHARFIKITDIHIEGTRVLGEQELRDSAWSFARGSYIYVFSRGNTLLYPVSRVRSHFLSTWNRIEDISIERNYPHEITIRIVERDPLAMWCEESASHCYFLDKQGYVFDRAPTFSGNVFLTYRGILDNNPIGKEYLPAPRFGAIASFVESLRTLGVEPISVVAKEGNDFEVSIASGGKILFNDTDSLETVFTNLASLLNEYNLVGDTATSSLDYIDLRFGNKLFFKLR